MDRIHIEGLLLRAVIGTKEEERKNKQDVVIHLTLWADLRRAGLTDRLEDTVNYRTLNKRIVKAVEGSECFLVEALAERIAAICLEAPGVERVRVRVDKPGALRFARTVGVEIERVRGGGGPGPGGAGDP